MWRKSSVNWTQKKGWHIMPAFLNNRVEMLTAAALLPRRTARYHPAMPERLKSSALLPRLRTADRPYSAEVPGSSAFVPLGTAALMAWSW
jgi:hypothetical protein